MYADPLGSPHKAYSDHLLAAGDHVTVELDPELWRMMQSNHGGWNDRMAQVHVLTRLYLVLVQNAVQHL